MSKNLVIVESPAKAKTISRFLGAKYKVLASMGHVRDLPKSEMGVDIENNFEPSYAVSTDKKKVVTQLKAELKKAETLWIATDEDREGEAIGWHLLEALKVDSKKVDVKRIAFHEITKDAILKSLKEPRTINDNVVGAQQARRILDRLVGYELSPLLWKTIKYGLSAGRVQSVAVRLIVEREREIEAFVPEEYWKIIGDFEKDKSDFNAELQRFKGKKINLKNEKEVEEIKKAIKGVDYQVEKVEKKEAKRKPSAPFITSTLQQEAARKLHFSVKKTMMLAQQLYEGIETDSESAGLITYMRTDSVNLAESALKDAKDIIVKDFGEKYALSSPRKFKGRKGAQEAHEAIRPVNISVKPASVEKFLSKDQFKLYELIWKRTLACQMQEAILNKVSVDIKAGDSGYTCRATGQSVKFSGFMEVYMEGNDEGDEKGSTGEKFLPNLEEGEIVDMKKMHYNQHFTKPPARYTEASLVKKLENEGIGRPSTYAPTISTIINRGYVEKEAKALRPTDIAGLVIDLLVEHFPNIVNYKFTAEMEDKLDEIEEGKLKWAPMIKEFYTPFHKNILEKTETIKKEDVLKERELGKDEKTGLEVVIRYGKFGAYVQLGKYTKEEVAEMKEKPKRASLPKEYRFETITLEEALKCLELPRDLGENKDGEKIIVTVGRFGPYLKVGKANFSLPEDFNPYTITFEEAVTVAKEAAKLKKEMNKPISELGQDPVSKGDILVKNGRFGPYITDGKTNVSIRKNIEPTEITLEQAIEMLEKKRNAKPRKRR